MEILKRKEFSPDYQNVVKAARNIEVSRVPLYEHSICNKVMEAVTGDSFGYLWGGDRRDKVEYIRRSCNFLKMMGYDTISFECPTGSAYPGSGALDQHIPGVINSRGL